MWSLFFSCLHIVMTVTCIWDDTNNRSFFNWWLFIDNDVFFYRKWLFSWKMLYFLLQMVSTNGFLSFEKMYFFLQMVFFCELFSSATGFFLFRKKVFFFQIVRNVFNRVFRLCALFQDILTISFLVLRISNESNSEWSPISKWFI